MDMRKFKPRNVLTHDFASGLGGEGLGLNSFSELRNPNFFSDLSIAAREGSSTLCIKVGYVFGNVLR